jgi:hypothetical protein
VFNGTFIIHLKGNNMEGLLGLVVLISSIVALIKFNATSSAVAKGAEVKAQVWAEELISDATVERAKNYKKFEDDTAELEIISHEEFMTKMKA